MLVLQESGQSGWMASRHTAVGFYRGKEPWTQASLSFLPLHLKKYLDSESEVTLLFLNDQGPQGFKQEALSKRGELKGV